MKWKLKKIIKIRANKKNKNDELNANVNNDIVESKKNFEEKNDENLPEKVEDVGGDIAEDKNKKKKKF
jgi:hypothetical protein